MAPINTRNGAPAARVNGRYRTEGGKKVPANLPTLRVAVVGRTRRIKSEDFCMEIKFSHTVPSTLGVRDVKFEVRSAEHAVQAHLSVNPPELGVSAVGEERRLAGHLPRNQVDSV